MMDLVEKIRLHSAATPPIFSESRLASLDTGFVYGSCERVRFDQAASVDLGTVAGTSHPDYAGGCWSTLVGRPFGLGLPWLKRIRQALMDLNANPEYYLSVEKKTHWSFLELDGVLYWTEGAHRTCVARYFFDYLGRPPVVHGVYLEVYRTPPAARLK